MTGIRSRPPPGTPGPTTRRLAGAAGLALLAAFVWATYYFFVLGAPGVPPSGLLIDPFLAGGLGLLALAGARGELGWTRRLLREPATAYRAALLVVMQVSVLAATYLAGPVDTALLSLLGDVVLTPIALGLLYAEGRGRFRSPLFVSGLVASTAGASLVIVAGAQAEALTGWAWVVTPVVPVAVALYFLYTARGNRETPMVPLVGVTTLVAAGWGAVVSPLLPGGVPGLWPGSLPGVALVVVLGLTSFALGPFLYFRAIERAGLLLPAVLMTAIPVFTLALDVAIDRTVPPLLALLGIPLAVAGAFLALRGPHAAWAGRAGGEPPRRELTRTR